MMMNERMNSSRPTNIEKNSCPDGTIWAVKGMRSMGNSNRAFQEERLISNHWKGEMSSEWVSCLATPPHIKYSLMQTVFDPVCPTRSDAREYAVFGKLSLHIPIPPIISHQGCLSTRSLPLCQHTTKLSSRQSIQLLCTSDTPLSLNFTDLTRLFIIINLAFHS